MEEKSADTAPDGQSAKGIKCKNMMYVQQLDHLPGTDKTVDAVVERIVKNVKPDKYAVIVHDQDLSDDGTLAKPHVHAMMSFRNARHLSKISKELGEDSPQQIEVWKGNANNGYAYLIHRTAQMQHKHQYFPDEVRANFDYVALINKIGNEVATAKGKSKKGNDVMLMLDAMYDGTITREDVEKRLTGSEYAKYKRQIEDVWNKRLMNIAEAWRKEMIEQGRFVKVIWIYGAAGTGKSSIAILYAEKAGLSYYRTGSSRDLFQRYAGERVLIIEELRPRSIPYEDLLRIIDPYSFDSMAPSRYSDKWICCEAIIICSPYSPRRLYDETFGIGYGASHYVKTRTEVDTFEQLNRRIALTMEVDEYYYRAVEYDEKHGIYNPVPGTSRKNPYSSIARPRSVNNAVTLFNEMFSGSQDQQSTDAAGSALRTDTPQCVSE